MRPSPLSTPSFNYLALLTLILSSPYAIPVPWFKLAQWLTGATEDSLHFIPSPVDNQQWYAIFGALTLFPLAVFFCRRTQPLSFSSRLICIFTIALFVWHFIRGILVATPDTPIRPLLLQASFLMVFLTGLSARISTSMLGKFQIAAAVSAVPLAILALMQSAGHDPLPYSSVVPGTIEAVQGKLLIASTFGHPNYMGSYLAPMLVLTAGMIYSPVSLKTKFLAAISALCMFAALLAGGTRGPLLGVLVGLAILHLVARSFYMPRKAFAIFSIFLILAAALAVAYIRNRNAFQFNFSDRLFASKEIASRAFYWVVGLDMWTQNRWLGVGPGQFDTQFWWQISSMPDTQPGGPWHFMLNSIVRGVRPGEMHNDHLQILVELGLVGAALWILLWSAVTQRAWTLSTDLKSGRSNYSSQANAANAAVASAMVAAAIDALFGFPFHLPCSGLLIWGLLGMWCGWVPPGNRHNHLQSPLLT